MTTEDYEDGRMEAYMARWNRFRRQTMVLTSPELLELVELLRELDTALARYTTVVDGFDVVDLYYVSEEGNEQGGIRRRLETLLGLHPGELDTKRRP